MSKIDGEIAAQPELWQRCAALAPELAHTLPAAGEQVAVAGCGTSLHIARAWATLREAAGRGTTDAFPASEPRAGRRYDAVVVISRSGTTTEVLRYLAGIEAARTVAITADPASPVASAVDEVVALDFADEEAIVQTRFATSALALLRAHLGESLDRAVVDAEAALAAPLPVQPSEFGHWVFLGRGWTVGLAAEAALKLREAAQAWTEHYPALEFRHGPISAATDQTVVWSLGPLDDDLREDVEATGATLVEPALDPLASLVLAQRTAVALGVEILPKDVSHASISGPDMWTVLDRGPNHVKSSFEFLKWFTSPKVHLQYALKTGVLPIRQSETKLPEYKEYLERYPAAQIFVDSLKNVTKARPAIPEYPEISKALGQAAQAILLGDQEPRAALDASAEQADSVLAGG